MDGSSDPIPDDSRQSLTQSGVGTEDGGRGIQPSHIREALRRLSVPSGPLLPLAVSEKLTSNKTVVSVEEPCWLDCGRLYMLQKEQLLVGYQAINQLINRIVGDSP